MIAGTSEAKTDILPTSNTSHSALHTFAMSSSAEVAEAGKEAAAGDTRRVESSGGGGGHALLLLSAPEESGALAGKKDGLPLLLQQRRENNENSSCGVGGDGDGDEGGGGAGRAGEENEAVDGQTSNDDDTAAEDSGLGGDAVTVAVNDESGESSDGGQELVAQTFIASPRRPGPAAYPPRARVAYIISTNEGNSRNNTTVTRIDRDAGVVSLNPAHYVSSMTSEGRCGTLVEEVEAEGGGNEVAGANPGDDVPESAAAQMRRGRQHTLNQQQRNAPPRQEQTRMQQHLLQQQQLSRISKDIRRRERRERRVRRQLLQRHRALYGAAAEHVGPAHHFSFSAADYLGAGGGLPDSLVMPPPPYSTLPTPGRRGGGVGGGQQPRGSRGAQENARTVRHLIPAGITMDIAR